MPEQRGGKVRRALHPVYRRLETTVHPLRYLFLEITQRCNLACRRCQGNSLHLWDDDTQHTALCHLEALRRSGDEV